MATEARSLPFEEAIQFYRDKLSLPTKAWDDLWAGMHARAFVVAGATRDELLVDLRGAIDQAISQGTTLEQFRREFDSIVAKHGWSYNGGRGWRTQVMLETNIRQAYQTGRWKQMTSPAVKAARPWWRYRHGHSVNPRPEHLSWDGLILSAEDPWWSTHYPMNGWGCTCRVETLSERNLKRLDLKPGVAPSVATYPHVNPRTGEIKEIPVGIDPGFEYSVGEAAFGRRLSKDAWKEHDKKPWKLLTPGTWQTYGRPARVPRDEVQPLSSSAQSPQETIALLKRIIGGEERVFTLQTQLGAMPVLVNAELLGMHLDPKRAPWLNLIEEVLARPYEVWMGFFEQPGSHKIELRLRLIKGIHARGEAMLMILNVRKGVLEAWTIMPTSDVKHIQNQRAGKLIFQRN